MTTLETPHHNPPGPARRVPERFSRADLDRGPRHRLSEGRWANAVLYRYEHRGQSWVVKDFAPRSFLVRNLIGRFLIRREVAGLCRVDGIAGAPSAAFRVDGHALAYLYVQGTSMRLLRRNAVGEAFFVELERDLREMHAKARLVHLDLRNAHNILVGEDGRPSLLDFQSWLGTRWLPGPLRRFAERIDMAAIYKHWLKRSPDSLGPERSAALARMNSLRPLWVLRGYIGADSPGKSRRKRR